MERILWDPDGTCVFMAPAITGSFGTGSSGNCVQNENYNYNLALVYGDKTILFFVFLCGSFQQKYTPANPTIPDKKVYTGIYNRLAILAVMVPIDHYSSYNIGLYIPGPKKENNALAFRPKEEKT